MIDTQLVDVSVVCINLCMPKQSLQGVTAAVGLKLLEFRTQGMVLLQATAAASASDLQTAIATAIASSQSSVTSTGGLSMPDPARHVPMRTCLWICKSMRRETSLV